MGNEKPDRPEEIRGGSTGPSGTAPAFTIVIPVYNRENEVGRAIRSCLGQSFPGWELVAVDDASTDGSADAVRREAGGDARVRLLRHRENRGVCEARNTGARNARGEWVLFLDSDDELMPGALARIYLQIVLGPRDAARYGFMYARDDGRFSPDPALEERDIGYPDYLKWLNGAGEICDIFYCTRRETFARVHYPEGRTYEDVYHLDFSREYLTRWVGLAVAEVHLGGEDRLTVRTASRLMEEARERAEGYRLILERHGEALKLYAPARHALYLRNAGLFDLLAGDRKRGTGTMFRYLWGRPLSPDGWVILFLGLLGKKLLAGLHTAKRSGLRIRMPGKGRGTA